jgi:hypothetical protein
VKGALMHARRAAAGMLSAGLLAGLGRPAIVGLVFVAVLVLGVVCWVIGSGVRSERVTRMILARRGDAGCLAPGQAASSAAARGGRRSARRAQAAHGGTKAIGASSRR